MFKDLLTANGIDEIHKTLINEDKKYLCFTTFDFQWTISVTDGMDVWRLNFDEDDLNIHRELANIDTDESFCLKFRNGFHSGDMSIAKIGTKLKLSIGKGESIINFDLYEAMAADKKTDFKNVLFRLAESATKLESNLITANQKIDKLQLEKSANKGTNALFDTGSKRGNAATKNKPKKVGMSVVNPNSKKRKAATGVVFD